MASSCFGSRPQRREAEGNDAVARLYTAFGTALHDQGRASELREADLSLIGDALAEAGLPASLEKAKDDERHDAVLTSETALALSRAGRHLGTPIITFAPGTRDEASFFGPVINRIPRGVEASQVWDAMELLARTSGFYELKRGDRTRRTSPDPADAAADNAVNGVGQHRLQGANSRILCDILADIARLCHKESA